MTLGHKSKYSSFYVTNEKNRKQPFKITIQANKNGAICDIEPRVGEVLSDFQGQQIEDLEVIESLKDRLFVEFNID